MPNERLPGLSARIPLIVTSRSGASRKRVANAVIALLIAAVAVDTSASLAQSQPPGCFPFVLKLAIANSQHPGPIPSIGCPPPPALPCVATAAPTVDFQVGEEARLTATASLEDETGVGNVVEARVEVSKKNINGGYDPVYSVVTTDSVQLGYMRIGSTKDFRFGVPGIDKDAEYSASVAFCYSFDRRPLRHDRIGFVNANPRR